MPGPAAGSVIGGSVTARRGRTLGARPGRTVSQRAAGVGIQFSVPEVGVRPAFGAGGWIQDRRPADTSRDTARPRSPLNTAGPSWDFRR